VPLSLKRKLERSATVDTVKFIVPYIFLPPRFKDISKNRNMILFVDLDLVTHVQWEGSLLDGDLPLKTKAVKRLVKECFRNMKKYQIDLKTFSKFVGEWGENPFWGRRTENLGTDHKPKSAEKRDETEVPAVVGGKLETVQISDFLEGMGGESPMPSGPLDW